MCQISTRVVAVERNQYRSGGGAQPAPSHHHLNGAPSLKLRTPHEPPVRIHIHIHVHTYTQCTGTGTGTGTGTDTHIYIIPPTLVSTVIYILIYIYIYTHATNAT